MEESGAISAVSLKVVFITHQPCRRHNAEHSHLPKFLYKGVAKVVPVTPPTKAVYQSAKLPEAITAEVYVTCVSYAVRPVFALAFTIDQ